VDNAFLFNYYSGGHSMSCPRCRGVMIAQDLHDHHGTYLTLPGWRCLSCGEVLDATILTNRQSAQNPTGRSSSPNLCR
jgi:hypothetical protein